MHSHITGLVAEGHLGASTIEARMRHSDGSWRHAEIQAQNLLGNPNVAGIVLHVRDITERTANEQALAEARDAALEGSRTKSEFLATMSP